MFCLIYSPTKSIHVCEDSEDCIIFRLQIILSYFIQTPINKRYAYNRSMGNFNNIGLKTSALHNIAFVVQQIRIVVSPTEIWKTYSMTEGLKRNKETNKIKWNIIPTIKVSSISKNGRRFVWL